MSRIKLIIFSFCLIFSACFCHAQTVQSGDDFSNLPKNVLTPPYFTKKYVFCWDNFKRIIRKRYEFLFGIPPEAHKERCYSLQKVIANAVKQYNKRHPNNPITEVNDKIIFSKNSPLKKYNIKKASLACSYCSYGNLNGDNGFIYCKYHGINPKFKIYSKIRKQIEKNMPFITPDDVVDICILLIFMMVPLISWFILIKALKRPSNK